MRISRCGSMQRLTIATVCCRLVGDGRLRLSGRNDARCAGATGLVALAKRAVIGACEVGSQPGCWVRRPLGLSNRSLFAQMFERAGGSPLARASIFSAIESMAAASKENDATALRAQKVMPAATRTGSSP